MFERRLKIFLSVLALASLVLFGRVFTLQVLGRERWAKAEQKLAVRPPELTETTRGRILDVRGTPLAVDTACTDAAVDYRAIVDPPDPKWVADVAAARLRAKYGPDFGKRSHTFTVQQRKDMLAEASRQVVADVNEMWDTLANLYRPTDPDAAAAVAADPRAALDEVRRSVVRTVEMRRRLLWTMAYHRAKDRAASSGGRVLRWLGLSATPVPADTDPDAGPLADVPDVAYAVTTDEQQSAHVVLHAVDPDGCAFLGKRLERFPGLSLRPSTHRSYPLGEVACHLLGDTGAPTAEQVERTKHDDPRTQYQPTEADVGREGVEALCEPLLRGVRGRVDRRSADGAVIDRQDFVPGRDVRLTIDTRLQGQAQDMLKHVVEHTNKGVLITPEQGVSMHGAVVVIDVKTNEVRALASNPTFDVNDRETRFAALNADLIDTPLRDRAIEDAVEPGSTVKPILGLSGVTQGTVGPLEGIECTGNMYLPAVGPDGRPRRIRMQGGRCWVVSEYGAELMHAGIPIDHHRVPSAAPHHGQYGNPDGWLTLADALERSCDVYFETMADRMGPNLLCQWYDRWGLGRATGIGLPHESAGLREDEAFAKRGGVALDYRRVNCLAGMGQDQTRATPLQIANAAAAIARGGVWMRPKLLTEETQLGLDAATPRPAGSPPDVVDLHLSPAALEQAKIGMRNVVDSDAGTGQLKEWSRTRPAWLTVAAKTGTADTAPFRYWAKGPDGQMGWQKLSTMVVRGEPETSTPWYRSETGKGVVHAWYMGYAPVEDPQVAFAVLIEYAGIGGGPAAGPVATQVLDACVADGYLHPPGSPATPGPTTNP